MCAVVESSSHIIYRMEFSLGADIYSDDFINFPNDFDENENDRNVLVDNTNYQVSFDNYESMVTIRIRNQTDINSIVKDLMDYSEFKAHKSKPKKEEGKARTRKNFPYETRKILHDWISKNGATTPKRPELNMLLDKTGLTMKQLRTFFTNFRVRSKKH